MVFQRNPRRKAHVHTPFECSAPPDVSPKVRIVYGCMEEYGTKCGQGKKGQTGDRTRDSLILEGCVAATLPNR
jgi:hypothetical protein